MSTWTTEELEKIGNTQEIRIATLRKDGTLRKKVIIWIVRVDDDLYVRSVNGCDGVWFTGMLNQHAGRIWAGGIEKDIAFVEEDDPEITKKIDEGYRTKYSHLPQYVAPMVIPKAREATLKVTPR